MKHFRPFLFLTVFLGMGLSGQAQKAPTFTPLIKRTYYAYPNRQLHEE